MNQKSRVISFNIIFWSALFFYKWIGFGALTEEYVKQFVYSIVNIPIAFLTAYISFHVVFEKHHTSKNQFNLYLNLIAIGLVAILLKRLFNHYYFEPNYLQIQYVGGLITLPKILFELVSLYLMVGLYGMFYFLNHWFDQRQQLELLNKEKVKTELDVLKSQVHPHFLFNMLNNIYAGALETSPETAQQILQLSNFIEYNLYHAQKDFVPVDEEFEYLKNFIGLHQIRLGDKLKVNIEVPSNAHRVQIPPLLLLPLIENCVKHGANNSIRPAWIDIQVRIKEDIKEICFEIANSMEEPVFSENGGVGLNNIRKRLQLHYPDKHLLNIVEEKGIFKVLLTIKYD
ncbi:sensor histidine kinase [Aquirufa sp. ROCK-SH2]